MASEVKGGWWQNLWLGMGCQSGVSVGLMVRAVQEVCGESGVEKQAIAGLATIHNKASEPAIISLCNLYNWHLQTFAPEVLCRVPVPNPSQITAQITTTPSVAEAAALLAVENRVFPANHHHLTVTLLVTKRIYRWQGKAVTIAIAGTR